MTCYHHPSDHPRRPPPARLPALTTALSCVALLHASMCASSASPRIKAANPAPRSRQGIARLLPFAPHKGRVMNLLPGQRYTTRCCCGAARHVHTACSVALWFTAPTLPASIARRQVKQTPAGLLQSPAGRSHQHQHHLQQQHHTPAPLLHTLPVYTRTHCALHRYTPTEDPPLEVESITPHPQRNASKCAAIPAVCMCSTRQQLCLQTHYGGNLLKDADLNRSKKHIHVRACRYRHAAHLPAFPASSVYRTRNRLASITYGVRNNAAMP